jgi:hypothetical protein
VTPLEIDLVLLSYWSNLEKKKKQLLFGRSSRLPLSEENMVGSSATTAQKKNNESSLAHYIEPNNDLIVSKTI